MGRFFVSWCALLGLILELGFSSPPTSKATAWNRGDFSCKSQRTPLAPCALPAPTLSFSFLWVQRITGSADWGWAGSVHQQPLAQPGTSSWGSPSSCCLWWWAAPRVAWGEARGQCSHPQNHTASHNTSSTPQTTSGTDGGASHHDSGSGCSPCNSMSSYLLLPELMQSWQSIAASPLPLSLFFLCFIFVYIYWATYCFLSLFNLFFI